MRQTDRQKRNPHSTNTSKKKRSGDQGKWRELAAAHRAKGRVQQNAAECTSPDRLGQGQRWSATPSVSPIWAHDSEAPWAMVVPEAWHRFRGQTRQGGWHLLPSRDEVSRRRSMVVLVRLWWLNHPPSLAYLGPSRVGMRPRRPLQDVREVTEVGELEDFLLLRVPGRDCPPWKPWHRGRKEVVGRAPMAPMPPTSG